MSHTPPATNESIAVGDLVQIVRVAKCGCPVDLGHVTVVAKIEEASWTVCPMCGDDRRDSHAYACDAHGKYISGIWRLKRIPPMEELEGEKRDDEITA